MPVYVDKMRAPFGRMVMCHMLADTDDELHAMADRIGVARRWHQKAGTPHSHYDIALSKRALALAAGAVEIEKTQLVALLHRKRAAARAPLPEGRDSQHVVKAEASGPDATDRETPAIASPVGGPMGARQPAAAGPAAGTAEAAC